MVFHPGMYILSIGYSELHRVLQLKHYVLTESTVQE